MAIDGFDTAAIATGSVNFSTIVYGTAPDFVRSLATRMRDNGMLPRSCLPPIDR